MPSEVSTIEPVTSVGPADRVGLGVELGEPLADPVAGLGAGRDGPRPGDVAVEPLAVPRWPLAALVAGSAVAAVPELGAVDARGGR